MIYYSHINEDNRIEKALLQEGKFPTAVVICGSGERVLSLMDCKCCKQLVVVDCNEEAIFLLQLKIAVLRLFSVDDYLKFIGHQGMPGEARTNMFLLLEKHLPVKAFAFWKDNLLLIKEGILGIGHFERFLQRARPLSNLWLGNSFHNFFKPEQHEHLSSS
jgi:S-adenosylmethionine:diacylglycerol 3-amino-3-carboxypropyl transferase